MLDLLYNKLKISVLNICKYVNINIGFVCCKAW